MAEAQTTPSGENAGEGVPEQHAAPTDAQTSPTVTPATRPANRATVRVGARERGLADPDPNIDTTTDPVIEHTPTPPLGTVTSDPEAAQPVVNTPPAPNVLQPATAEDAEELRKAAEEGRHATITVANPAANPGYSRPAPSMEVAAPAPLPRPGDENLTAGTDSHYVREGTEGEQEAR